jgi:hypothetical protein
MHSLVKSGEDFDTLTRRVKERARREKLHREIGALEAKCDRIADKQLFNWRARVWKLMSKIKRLKAQLAQPELFL